MPVYESERFANGDIYIDYEFEDVKFRWDHSSQKVFRKFYGQAAEAEVPQENKLFNEALLHGSEISKKEYFQ